jgi:uncharacterized LabA/DUF88 family protein
VGKNVAVFVDVANIFYAAKAAGVDIDYVTLLKSATAGRDLVRAYAYTGLDPDNENQRNFHSFLARNGYKVVSKDIRKYGDGKVKANLDIELVVDMMKTARNLDIAIVVSGDGDFAPAIRAVQEMGVRCEVISFRGNTSSDLIEVADLFTDITQLAKVEKGSRSGRRVAEDEQDLSMTEVPDKQTEGTGRGRGRGRGRDRAAEREPVAASARGRGRRRGSEAASENGASPIVALPGERLSRVVVGDLTEADLAQAEVFTLDDEEGAIAPAAELEVAAGDDVTDDGGQRRRRRRGGRGRGRGRGRAEGEAEVEAVEADAVGAEAPDRAPAVSRPILREEDEEEELPEAPRRPRSTPFGSVWDSQLGTSTPTPTPLAPLPDDEEFDDEPEIPEYLIAERNRKQAGRGRGGGPRGGRAAYQSAIARERFGSSSHGAGGINRYPDVSERTGRGRGPEPRREDRGPRPERAPAHSAPRSSAEWSEVPPELEELLRAQLGQRGGDRPAGRPSRTDAAHAEGAVDTVTAEAVEAAAATEAPAETSRRRPATRRRSTAEAQPEAAEASPATPAEAAEEAPAATTRRTTRRRTAAKAEEPATGTPSTETPAAEAPAATTGRTTRRTSSTAPARVESTETPAAELEAPAEAAAPKPARRRSSRTAATEEAAAVATTDAAETATPAPRRRTTRKAAPTETA